MNILDKEISQFIPRAFVSYKSAYCSIAQDASKHLRFFF